jgi:hypothetical protein
VTEPRVTIDDVRKAGFCVAGAKRWFAANRLDFAAFLKDGMAQDEFLRSGDALAAQVVTSKQERAARG